MSLLTGKVPGYGYPVLNKGLWNMVVRNPSSTMTLRQSFCEASITVLVYDTISAYMSLMWGNLSLEFGTRLNQVFSATENLQVYSIRNNNGADPISQAGLWQGCSQAEARKPGLQHHMGLTCVQQRRRPACTSAHSDQHICYSLSNK